MHVLFINFKQVLSLLTDKNHRDTTGIEDTKQVGTIKMTIQNMEATVKIENLTSNPFSISSGLRQGDPLSATIFYLILDLVIKKLNLRGDVSLKLKQIVAYADDVALLDRSLKALKEIFHKLKNEATLVGLSNKKIKPNTVESRSIVSTSIVFQHVLFAIFGPELSSI